MKAGTAAIAVIGAIAISTCTHMVTLTPRDGGPIGHGQATGSGLGYSGKMTVDLDGRRYDGEWVYQDNGGMIGFGTSTAFSGGHVATAYGNLRPSA